MHVHLQFSFKEFSISSSARLPSNPSIEQIDGNWYHHCLCSWIMLKFEVEESNRLERYLTVIFRQVPVNWYYKGLRNANSVILSHGHKPATGRGWHCHVKAQVRVQSTAWSIICSLICTVLLDWYIMLMWSLSSSIPQVTQYPSQRSWFWSNNSCCSITNYSSCKSDVMGGVVLVNDAGLVPHAMATRSPTVVRVATRVVAIDFISELLFMWSWKNGN